MTAAQPGRLTARVSRASAVFVLAAASVLGGVAPASADPIRDAEYWLDDYGIREAWNTTRGAGVKIAIIDTGVDGSVPDLSGAVTGGSDFSGLGSSNGQRPVGSEGSWHGTMVASLAAGRGTGATSGVLGSAPEASILALSIGFGEGTTSSEDQIANAVRWAVDNGADVINMSLTNNVITWPESWDDAFLYAMENDVVIVAAAGNRGSGTTQVSAPATMPGVLSVAGVDRNGQASFDASAQGITLGVAAPSEDLVGVAPGGSYRVWQGTSGATPIVAGIVALVIAAHPELDAANVINRIVSTARDVGVAGADYIYGNGLIDAEAAVNADVELVTENPMGDLAAWITLHRRAQSTETPTPAPSTAPRAEPAPVAGPQSPLGTLLPTVNQLRNVGIPLAVVVGFGGAFIALAVMAVRRFRGIRQTE